jgi:hypothetical protein
MPVGCQYPFRCINNSLSLEWRSSGHSKNSWPGKSPELKLYRLLTSLEHPGQRPAVTIAFIRPISRQAQRMSLEVLTERGLVRHVCSIHLSEKMLYVRFVKIGILPGEDSILLHGCVSYRLRSLQKIILSASNARFSRSYRSLNILFFPLPLHQIPGSAALTHLSS